jgi:hypothetical protein
VWAPALALRAFHLVVNGDVVVLDVKHAINEQINSYYANLIRGRNNPLTWTDTRAPFADDRMLIPGGVVSTRLFTVTDIDAVDVLPAAS